MEETLRDLQLVMAAHRQALSETAPMAAEAPLVTPAVSDARSLVMRRLARDVERVSGLEVSGLMQAKLARVLASVALGELECWIGRLSRLPSDHPEWLSLIESLTVHETFFHRDRAQLDLLAAILPEAIDEAATSGHCRLRLWSAGCATGEEAYTLAIKALLALRDAGFAVEMPHYGIVCRPPWRLEVLGTDISRLVLAQARTAVYANEGLSPFRDLPPELRRFFPRLPKRAGAGADTELRGVAPAIRRCVRFVHFNLRAGMPPETGMDIVLCRNVLIYLTPAARIDAQAVCSQALRPGGYLLLGPTDALAVPAAFTARWGPGAMAYRLKPGNA